MSWFITQLYILYIQDIVCLIFCYRNSTYGHESITDWTVHINTQ